MAVKTTNKEFIPHEINASLKTLSIVHISNGEKISPGEFTTEKITKNNKELLKIIVPDVFKIAKTMEEKKETKQFHDLLKTAYKQRVIPQKLDKLMKEHKKYTLLLASNVDKVNTEYLEQVKTANQIYIPGSTIKGAILTAMYNHVLEKLTFEYFEIEQFLLDLIEGKTRGNKKKTTLKEELDRLVFLWLKYKEDAVKYFNKRYSDKKEDKKEKETYRDSKFHRWLRITDTNTIPITNNLYLFSLERFPSNIPTFAECISFNKTFQFKIAKQQDLSIEINEILQITNEHYKKIFEREAEWFEKQKQKLNTRAGQKKAEFLNNLRLNFYNKNKNNEKTALLRIGFGSGLYSTSILPFIEKYAEETGKQHLIKKYVRQWKLTRNNIYPEKTKWLVNVKTKTTPHPLYYPLGWVKIEIQNN